MGKVGKAAVVVVASAKLAVKYGPQAKIAWDKGGKQAAAAATQRARTMTSRRKAFAHAATVVDGSVLKIAPDGTTAYVVFSGEQPIAAYPPQDLGFPTLLAHVDLDRRVPAEQGSRRPRGSGPKGPRALGRPGRPAGPPHA
jgi:hypothetical protein